MITIPLNPSINTVSKNAIALDPRILNADSSGGMKVAACAERVFSIWSESEDKTQLVFCDLSTPSVGKNKTKDFTVYEDLKALLS